MKFASRPASTPLRAALIASILTFSAGGVASAESADKDAKQPPKGDAAQEQAMAEMMKYAMPGPMHDVLKPMAGNFNAAVKMWEGPGEPQATQGSCQNTWILGGRFLQCAYKGEFAGQPFEGFGLTGYDTMKRQYVGLWMDTMGTTVMISNGSAEAPGKAITMNSSMDDPRTGKPMPIRSVTKIVDDNQHVYSMYTTQDGKETLMMEITYTRAK